MDNYFSNMNLVKIFLKWKWHLLILMAIAAVIAVIISSPWVIKPKFRSTAVLYPANISPYSDESETEQMLQWLNSRDIMDSMIIRFDLSKHYEIPQSHRHYNSIIEYLYNENVRISKTQFESVRIEVLDTDPVRARDMVYAIIDLLTLKIRKTHKEKYAEVVTSYKQLLDSKHKEIDSVLQQHYILRTVFGLLDYGNQTREVARGHLRTVDGNNAQHVNVLEVEKLKKNLEEKGGDFIYYNTLIYSLLEQLARIQSDYEAHLYHYNKEFTYANIVSHPVVADKKVYPVRWLIMAYALVAAALFGLISIALIENSGNIEKKFSEETKS